MITIYFGVCRIYTPHHLIHHHCPVISVQPPVGINVILYGIERRSFEMDFEAGIVRVRDTYGRLDQANLMMYLDALIVRAWRTESSVFGVTIEGRD